VDIDDDEGALMRRAMTAVSGTSSVAIVRRALELADRWRAPAVVGVAGPVADLRGSDLVP
jgi:hypothetical protein